MAKTHLEKLDQTRLFSVYKLSFVGSAALAIVSYWQSVFVNQFIGVDEVGWIFVAGYALSFALYQLVPLCVQKIGKYNTAFGYFFLAWLFTGFLVTARDKILVLSLFVVYVALLGASDLIFDFLIENFSVDEATGRIRAIYTTVTSLAWVSAGILSGIILDTYGFSAIFFFTSVLLLCSGALFLYYFRPKDLSDRNVSVVPVKYLWHLIWSARGVRPIFLVNFLLSFFFSWTLIYVPIYLLSLGITVTQVGFLLSVMVFAYVFFNYPVGWLVDTRVPEKFVIMIGFVVMAVSTELIFFVQTINIWWWMTILFVGRVGASLVMSATEAFFFKSVDKRDISLMTAYRAMVPAASALAPLGAIAFLAISDLPLLFLALTVVMSSGAIIALKLHHQN